MNNLGNILKSRGITLAINVHLVKVMVFPVDMYECKSWTIKKTGHQTTDACDLWCWRRLLRVPWTARRSNQSILKEICPEYSLAGLMLKLKLQYFGTSCEELTHGKDAGERLKAVGEGDDRGWDGWMELPTWWTWVCTSSGSWWRIGKPIPSPNLSRETWRASVHGVRFGQDWATEPNWLCLYSRNGTANSGFVLHICLQHGLLNILSRLLLPTAQEKKEKRNSKYCFWDNVLGHLRAVMETYNGVNIVFLPADTTSKLMWSKFNFQVLLCKK